MNEMIQKAASQMAKWTLIGAVVWGVAVVTNILRDRYEGDYEEDETDVQS